MKEINHQIASLHKRTRPDLLVKGCLREDIYVSSPWIVIFISVLLVGAISYTFKNETEADFYYGSLINAIVGALIIASCFSFLFIRFLLHKKSKLTPERVKASLVGALVIIAFVSFAVGTVFLIPLTMPMSYKVFYILFFILFTCSLELFIIQSTLTVFPFLSGLFFVFLLSIPFVGFVGREIAGSLGYILGLALAQVIIFFFQWFLLTHQWGGSFALATDYFRFATEAPYAIAIGFFCVGGVFTDTILSLFFGSRDAVYPAFQLSYSYNIASALALGAVLPAFIYFILRAEKGVYRRYTNFYEMIRCKKTRGPIMEAKNELLQCILSSATAMLTILIISVFLCTYFATQLYTFLGLDLEDIPLFRSALWGNSLYLLFTSLCIILFYMEFNRTVLFLYVGFAVLNTIVSASNMLYFHFHPMYIFPFVSLTVLIAAIAVTGSYFSRFVRLHFKYGPFGMHFKPVTRDECSIYLLNKGNPGE